MLATILKGEQAVRTTLSIIETYAEVRAMKRELLALHAEPDARKRNSMMRHFGEALTGDIPSFYKTDADEAKEDHAIEKILSMLPEDTSAELAALFAEMEALETPEAKLFKALDNMEAVVSHNEAPISTWIPLEYTENLVYGQENAAWSEWTRHLRDVLREDSLKKIEREGKKED